MSDFLVDLRAKGGEPSLREVIEPCIDNMPEHELDAPIGRDRSNMFSDEFTSLTTGLHYTNKGNVNITDDKSVFRRDDVNVPLDFNGKTDDHTFTLQSSRDLIRKEYKDRIISL